MGKSTVIEFRAYAVKKDGTLWAWGEIRNLLIQYSQKRNHLRQSGRGCNRASDYKTYAVTAVG
ncbi:MAG: hypothetical protein ACLRTD_10430 [Bacteroides sp.]